jgi:hypothetical protein
MKQLQYILFTILFSFLAAVSLQAQPSTLYYMNYLPYQSYMNPAIQPACRVYVELPGISAINFSMGNNSVSINDLIYLNNGQMVTALHPDLGDRGKLLNAFSNTTRLYQDFSISLFGLGFKIKEKGYLTLNTSIKQDMAFYMPKDIPRLLLYGTPNEDEVNSFDFQSLGMSFTAYMDMSAGYSHKINEQWTVGLRTKLLVGLVDANLGFSELELHASKDEWRVIGNGAARFSASSVAVDFDTNGEIEDITIPDDVMDALASYRPNLGVGFDVGVVYKPIENLNLSFAVRDLGVISWRSGYAADGEINFSFEGINVDISDTDSDYADSIVNLIADAYQYDVVEQGYTSWLKSKIYLGGEYTFLKNKMSVGLLSKTIVANQQLFGEVTASLNMRPLSWFGTSLSYSMFNGNFSSMGVGFNLRLPPFSFYVAGDYFPTHYSKDYIPYKVKGISMQTGMVMTFGCKAKKAKKPKVEEDKSAKMLRLQQEMMLLQQDKEKEEEPKAKKEEVIYAPVQRMQDPTGILQQTNNEKQLTPQQSEVIETTIEPIVGETDNLNVDFGGSTTQEVLTLPNNNTVESKDAAVSPTTNSETQIVE